MKSKKISKKVLALALATVMFIVVGSFAYFSDNVVTSTQGTAGTVALSLDSDINFLDALGQDILNPGDKRDASFTVTNEGNKSVDVRTTIKLTGIDRDSNPINFTGDATTQSEFDLYLREDVELIEGRGWMPKEDAIPVQVKSIDGNVIIYIIPEYSLNGNSDKYDEVETIDGVDTFTHEYDYVLLFKGTTGNEWQGSSITMDVLVEAKQHENTEAGWEVVAQETVKNGSIDQDAVIGENIITPDADNNKTGKAWFRVIDAEYFSLKEAVEAVKDGGTIEYIGDGSPYVNTDYIDAYGKNFTIISNGAVIHNAGTMTGFGNVNFTETTVEDGYWVYGYGDYYDLQLACDVAESGDIIYVMDNCVITNDVLSSGKEITFMPLYKDVTLTIDSVVNIEYLNIIGNNGYTITFNITDNGYLGTNNPLYDTANRTITVGNGASILGTGNNILIECGNTTTLTIKNGGMIGEANLVLNKNYTLNHITLNIEDGAIVRDVNTITNFASSRATINISDGAILDNVTTIKG